MVIGCLKNPFKKKSEQKYSLVPLGIVLSLIEVFIVVEPKFPILTTHETFIESLLLLTVWLKRFYGLLEAHCSGKQRLRSWCYKSLEEALPCSGSQLNYVWSKETEERMQKPTNQATNQLHKTPSIPRYQNIILVGLNSKGIVWPSALNSALCWVFF